ncbi:OmpH family outer membrane protein [Seleniivibrio woodruffii]|uniref:Periplasmic chaperone for outer membrane proteins Skp n=1 Tax=Seleniivibrio woodruffii TaxID=1078050 RepID=A0A4R1KE94_9BACT|nr:OmpH family outer membrane protein [Seleniivibrio woodruffii]TCK62437.1 periplasmic chaperone for outer membrane proteins Skp [Seleniivibrio woodruffii]TVZ34445.1 periplasmic chaperone for outer membrane proteins Skp [Seleniivibrio woodruffii]
MRTKLFFLLLIMAVFSASAYAKIGVLDFQKVLKESDGGKDVTGKLQAKADEYDKKLSALNEAIKKNQQEYAAKENVANEDYKEKKRAEIQRQIRDFNQNKDDYAKELKRLEMRYLKTIQDDVLKIISSLGQELDTEIILEQNTSGVLYLSPKVDITDVVIQRYNTVFKQQKK